MITTLLLGLCACGGGKSYTVLNESSQAAENIPVAPDPGQADDETPADAYVIVEDTETEYGLISIPQIDETLLDNEDVRLANDMFKNIRDWLLERVADCKSEWGEESYHDAAEPLCVARYARNGNVLSIAVKYLGLYPYSDLMELNEAVSIDISTGKALDHHDVIDAAGFMEDEVTAALRWYVERFMFYEWEREAFFECAYEGTLPDGMGDPSIGWQEELDDIAEKYDAPVQPKVDPWDALPRYPTVFMSDNGLEVCITVPIETGAGYCDAMVCIGHNDAETTRFNPNTPFGEPFGRGAMLIDAAYEAVAQSFGLHDAYTGGDGVQYSLSAESMELMDTSKIYAPDTSEIYEPAYVFRAFTDEDNHIVTSGWYAVGVFSGWLWEMEITTGEWLPVMNGSGLLPEEVITVARSNGSLAAIWNEPGEYGLWASSPCAEIDMTVYGSGTSHYESGGETLLLFAVEDGTLVSFDDGFMEDDSFASQSQFYSLTLDAGESVLVHAIRPEGEPTQAITVSTEADAGIYILQYNGEDGTAKFEYVTSLSAMG